MFTKGHGANPGAPSAGIWKKKDLNEKTSFLKGKKKKEKRFSLVDENEK